jgi:hypothetical protein
VHYQPHTVLTSVPPGISRRATKAKESGLSGHSIHVNSSHKDNVLGETRSIPELNPTTATSPACKLPLEEDLEGLLVPPVADGAIDGDREDVGAAVLVSQSSGSLLYRLKSQSTDTSVTGGDTLNMSESQG